MIISTIDIRTAEGFHPPCTGLIVSCRVAWEDRSEEDSRGQDRARIAGDLERTDDEPSAAPVTFNRDIRPILSDHCYPCHGPDAGQAQGRPAARLESSARADRRRASRAIVPGDVGRERALRRITAADADERMPPPKSGKSLTAAEIETLRRWIAEGSAMAAALVVHPAGAAGDSASRTTGVGPEPDRRLHPGTARREGLEPSAEAERGILLRRVTLDLTGPAADSLAEIDAFERDDQPDAYEKVVDRLLASPRFGERMAIRWLNAARYADTNGYQTDCAADHVAVARLGDRRPINRNMPFDRFTDRTTRRRHAARRDARAEDRDRLQPQPSRQRRRAASSPRNMRVEYVVDRVDTTATVWLGLTVWPAPAATATSSTRSRRRSSTGSSRFFNNIPENGRAIKYGNSPPLIKAPTRAQQQELDRCKSSDGRAERKAGRGLRSMRPRRLERASSGDRRTDGTARRLGIAGRSWHDRHA